MFQIRLKELREEMGISQYEFARRLGVAQSTVGGWESGKREPNFDTLKKIAEFFNTSVDYLLGRTNQRNPNKPKLPPEFKTPEEAAKFILEQNVIMGYGGFDINKLSDEEKIEFANELLRQLKLLSYKYKK